MYTCKVSEGKWMKIFHTADWHLGKIVQSVHMTEDQRFVLKQFVEDVRKEQPDVVIIAGDIYDRAVPPTEAVALLNGSIDAVSICTWNDTHAEISIAALEAGKHVLVEKPLSMTVEEAEAVEEAVKRSGKVLQVGFVRRHADNARILKEFIDADDLGEIYYE